MVGRSVWLFRKKRTKTTNNDPTEKGSQVKRNCLLWILYWVQSKMLHVFYFMMLLADNLCAIIKILSTSTWHTTNSYTKWAFNGFAGFFSSFFCEFIYIGNLQKCGCFSLIVFFLSIFLYQRRYYRLHGLVEWLDICPSSFGADETDSNLQCVALLVDCKDGLLVSVMVLYNLFLNFVSRAQLKIESSQHQ